VQLIAVTKRFGQTVAVDAVVARAPAPRPLGFQSRTGRVSGQCS
jgi:hypothetical protein